MARSRSQSPAARVARRTVAIVGSTGGGAANSQALGSENGGASLSTLIQQLHRAGIHVAAAVFTSCDEPMDTATDASTAALWGVAVSGIDAVAARAVKLAEGKLGEVNAAARAADRRLASSMPDGIVMISGDVDGVNAMTISAAAAAAIPIVCTGGTGTGKTLSMGGNVIQGGGSVATTRETRAIAFTSALAAHWGLGYSPRFTDRPIDPHSLLDGCLPAFLAVVLLKWCATLLPPEQLSIFGSGDAPLPPPSAVLSVVTCVIAAQQASQLGEIGLMGGAVAGVLVAWPWAGDPSSGGGLAAGLGAGLLVGQLCPRLLSAAFACGFPATGATIGATGLSGATAGLIVRGMGILLLRVAPASGSSCLVSSLTTLGISGTVRHVLGLGLSASVPMLGRLVFGALTSALFVFGSKVGW